MKDGLIDWKYKLVCVLRQPRREPNAEVMAIPNGTGMQQRVGRIACAGLPPSTSTGGKSRQDRETGSLKRQRSLLRGTGIREGDENDSFQLQEKFLEVKSSSLTNQGHYLHLLLPTVAKQ